jgi:hypothetical protein
MSLKGFHIVFVTISTLLCVFLALWAYLLNSEPSTMSSILGVIGIIGALLMPVYGVYFYRKAGQILL